MKRGILIATVFLIGTMCFAQVREAEEQAEQMREALSLNSDQYVKIKEILQRYEITREGLATATATWEDNSEAMDSLMSERRRELKSVLTKEQLKKWASYKKEDRAVNNER